jgi:hypothetical protein
VAHLAGADQVGHRTDRVLDRRLRVHAVLVEEVDRLDTEALQAAVARSRDVRRRRVDCELGKAEAELGGDHEAVALAADRPAQQLLVHEGAVYLGGVEEGDAELERPRDRGETLALGRRAVVDESSSDHRHAAEAECRDFETIAQGSVFHSVSSARSEQPSDGLRSSAEVIARATATRRGTAL